MNYMEIDRLKNFFTDMLKDQNTIRSLELGIEGKLMAIGYNPYWTSKYDSKIEKLELNFLSSRGMMVPIILKNIVDYECYPKDTRRNRNHRINLIEVMILTPYANPRNVKDYYDRIRLEIIYDD